VAQFAFPQVSLSLAPLRGYAITRTLSRIGTADGCRGQDPTAPPDWLSSPLQLGMAEGRDYVTGTAVGAPVVVVLAACVGPFVGVAFYFLGLARSRLWHQMRRAILRSRRWRLPRSAVSVFSGDKCAVAAASGAATLMAMAAAVVSQAAAATAVLRVAEGAVNGTPGWYPAAAAVGAVASVLLPMVALHVAWVWSRAMYIPAVHRTRVDGVGAFRPRGLRRGGGQRIGIAGEYMPLAAVTDPLLPVAPPMSTVMFHAAGEALYNDYRGGGYGMLAVAQFVVASQALQGIAQSAGEFTDDARASCINAACAQLTVMAVCTIVLLWLQPHRVRRNFYAELIPTAMQAGLCALVVILAARRWTVNATISAGVEAGIEATSMLQPLLSMATVLFDAVA
jgi:hypothetical protein